jgi:Ca-activated chloride channel homolog
MSAAVPLIVESPDGKSLFQKRRPLGRLDVTSKGQTIKLPLAAVDIQARVADRLAHVTINQKFHNPFNDHLEAVYIFPLSGGCAVSAFQMKVGDRIVEGVVREREQARAEYQQAMQQGRRAALMEQERENVFTVQVGNLPPGEEVTIVLSYSEKLPYFDQGTTELRLPLVVAPRYIAGTALERENVGDGIELDTDQVPDASRISPPRLVAGVDAMVALAIKVTLESEDSLEDLACSQHVTRLGVGDGGIVINLLRDDEIMDRDFILRWRLADDTVRSKFLVYKDSKKNVDGETGSANCYGMLSLVPPRADDMVRPNRDVLFVIDRSGSMQGLKMLSAARACSFLINTLGPDDRFAIQIFDDQIDWLQDGSGERFFDADEEGLVRADDFLRGVEARGGTALYEALVDAIAVMSKRQSTNLRLPIIVMLTDGEISNEPVVYKHIQNCVGDIRLFTVGIDTAVNDAFLRRLAGLGGGTASFVAPGEQLENALTQVGREIGTPLVRNLIVEDINCGLDQTSFAPGRLADLFEGRAVNLFFRMDANRLKNLAKAKIRVRGKYEDGQDFVSDVTAQATQVEALPQLWARAHVAELEDRYRVARAVDQTALKKQIVSLAIEHSLLSKFTAFVAVDQSEIVNADGNVRKIVQPVAVPAAWEEEGAAPSTARHREPPAEWSLEIRHQLPPPLPLTPGARLPRRLPAAGDRRLQPTAAWTRILTNGVQRALAGRCRKRYHKRHHKRHHKRRRKRHHWRHRMPRRCPGQNSRLRPARPCRRPLCRPLLLNLPGPGYLCRILVRPVPV